MCIKDKPENLSELVPTSLFLSFLADTLTHVRIVPPIQISGDQLPAMLNLVFRVSVSTYYNSYCMRNVSYVWDFGDGRELATEPSITHMFNHAGSYNVTCTVSNGTVHFAANSGAVVGGGVSETRNGARATLVSEPI